MNKLFTGYALTLLLSIKLFGFDFTTEPKQISAHYIAPSQNLQLLISKFQNNGFTVLATTKIIGKYTVITISNQELQNTNSYMATLQVNVNDKEIRVQNPSYLAAAYLGNAYVYGQFKNTVDALEHVLGTLHGGFQKTDFSTLGNYRFMYGLPKKEDILIIKRAVGLLEKISTIKSEPYIAYTLTLPNGAVLVGHHLRTKTTKFLQILSQEENAQILPYEAMITGNQVSIMNPKYYLALSLPMLSLHQFMQIAAVPDQIYRNIEKAYR
ncbi:MAG: Unknown protein [uncultured Sulfurovum sp.]|uniref:Uncharacterized protein n=1 Tax=uncultured Sulfurovum sp. TaxID=269237 RepID=A0A6S6UGY3_9BACT|nr:MAG: Unknown protein [uncultured Sulfurovum sp.]